MAAHEDDLSAFAAGIQSTASEDYPMLGRLSLRMLLAIDASLMVYGVIRTDL
jgi:hypothetical protein